MEGRCGSYLLVGWDEGVDCGHVSEDQNRYLASLWVSWCAWVWVAFLLVGEEEEGWQMVWVEGGVVEVVAVLGTLLVVAVAVEEVCK